MSLEIFPEHSRNSVGLLIVLVIVGAALYLLTLIPIDATMKQIIKVLVIVIVIIYVILFLASLLGYSTGLPAVRLR